MIAISMRERSSAARRIEENPNLLYQESLLTLERAVLYGPSAVLVVVSMEDLRDVFRVETTGGRTPTTAKQRVMAALTEQFPDDSRALLTTLVVPKPKVERPQQRLTDRYLQEHVKPATLIAFGVLLEEDWNNVNRVVEAKRRFIAAALTILKTVANFEQPTDDLRERVKQAMGS